MTPAKIAALLKQAFVNCANAGQPLTPEQERILLEAVVTGSTSLEGSEAATTNPLDELTPEQRQALLNYVEEQEQQGRSWKIALLNDWLEGRSSGAVQFIRDQYGLTWLEQIQPIHLSAYAEGGLKLKVGDRIEVCNALWEWVQEDSPTGREWFPCTVVSIREHESLSETDSNIPAETCCTVRFDSGDEYEIQGIYSWNRYNWRFV